MPDHAPATEADATALLRQAIGDPAAELRDGQWEIIDQLVNHRSRVLAVQATGWGKSMVYFVATKLLRERGFSTTIIVSPLLALMRNQRAAAERLGLVTIDWSSENQDQWPEFERRLATGEVDVLLVSPERLANPRFAGGVLEGLLARPTMLVVDEAHCISDWGHDFRPDYQRLKRILARLPEGVPVLGTTATANDRVVDDVRGQLGADAAVVRGPLARRSLRLQALPPSAKAERLGWLAQHLGELPGSGIIYVLTKRDAEQVSRFLARQGHAVRPYYSRGSYGGDAAGGESDAELEQMLLDGRVKALVATTKLGMGFDKPDLGFVVHYQLPASVIAYYQQIGRAGRAVDEAVCVVMQGEEDERINEYFVRNAVPERRHLEAVVEALAAAAPTGLNKQALGRATDLRTTRLDHVLVHLAALEPAPVEREGSTWRATGAPLVHDDAIVEARKAMKRAEFQTMRELASPAGGECMMLPILRALDDEHATGPCGRCAHCVGAPIVDPSVSAEMLAKVQAELRHLDVTIEPRKMWPAGGKDELGVGGKIPAGELLEPGRALCSWGDPGIGARVREAVRAAEPLPREHEVAVALADMVARWRPEPAPQWVTWVPSRAREGLVRSLAEAVAARLGVPVVEAVRRVDASRPPQRTHSTSYHQALNVWGAFEVDASELPAGTPGIVVDDQVDSRWTFTIVGRALRKGGAGEVFPVALVDAAGADLDA